MAKENIEVEVTGFQSLRAQLKEANMEVQKMVALFGETSPQVAKAAARAADLKDQMDDARDAVNAFTGAGKIEAFGKAIQGVAGGFTAIQGAMGLVGVESKDLEQTMLKVQSALALTQGLAALEDVGRAFGTLKSVAVNAFNGIKAAIGSTGIGLLIVGLGIAVGVLVDKLNQASKSEKENKKNLENLGEAAKQAEKDFQNLNTTITNARDLQIAQAELAGKSEKQLNTIRINSIQEQLEAVDKQKQKDIELFTQRWALTEQTTKKGEERNKALEALQKEYDDLTAQRLQTEKGLIQELALADIKYRKDEKDRAKKAVEDAKARVKERAKNEKEALLELNESKRKLEEALTLDELQLAQVKYDNDLERLKEAKDKELAQENLTAKARKDIKEKYANEEEILLVEFSKTQQDIIDKRQKDAIQKEKEYQAAIKEIRDKELADQIQNTNDYFTQRETQLIESGLTQRELTKAQDDLELERLEAQLQNAKDYGESTVEIEKQIAEKKKKIAQDEYNNKIQIAQASLQQAAATLDALSSLTQANMSRDLAAAKDDAEKREQIKKEYFEKDKAYQYGKTVIAGAQAGMQAFAQGMELGGPPLAGIFLGLAVLQTLIQLGAISRTEYTGSAGGGSGSGSDSGGRGAGSQYAEGGLLMGPSHDMGGIRTTLGEFEGGEFIMNKRSTANFLPLLERLNEMGNVPGPQLQVSSGTPVVKAYVLASDVTSAQEANARLKTLARL